MQFCSSFRVSVNFFLVKLISGKSSCTNHNSYGTSVFKKLKHSVEDNLFLLGEDYVKKLCLCCESVSNFKIGMLYSVPL